jgi:hypothetical protein
MRESACRDSSEIHRALIATACAPEAACASARRPVSLQPRSMDAASMATNSTKRKMISALAAL